MKKYGVIYSDPPWKFKTYSPKGLGRSAEAWYDCLTLEEIKSLPVQQFCLPDCVLLLWTTDPFLRLSFDVIDSWGFTYKTVGFVWAKCTTDRPDDFHDPVDITGWAIGTGYWTRANPEHCLLATRGNPKRLNSDVRELIVAPRREHSRKPDEMYCSIERLCSGPYLELFARNPHPGWDSLGNEVDTGPLTERRWKSNAGPAKAPPADLVSRVADAI